MTPEEYIKNRLDDQIEWYDRKSIASQRWYKRLRLVEIILASTIPFLVGYITPEFPKMKLLVGLGSVLIAIISGVLALQKFQENWIEYRTTCETLKHHKYRYLTRVEPYSCDDAFQRLVGNVESLISKENTNWAEYIKAQRKGEQHA